MAKGTSQAEVTSSSEKIKPVALAIVKLHKFEGNGWLISYSSGQKSSRSV